MHLPRRALLVACLLSIPTLATAAENPKTALWAAVRNGDTKAVESLLAKGADVNAKNEIGVTALWLAAGKGDLDLVKLLVKNGADVNARDGIWYQTPLSYALSSGKTDLVEFLLKSGAADVEPALLTAAATGRVNMIETIVKNAKVRQEVLDAALVLAKEREMTVKALEKAGARPLPVAPERSREEWAPLAGTYENDNGGKLTVQVQGPGLVVGSYLLTPAGKDSFKAVGHGEAVLLTFDRKGKEVPRFTLKRFTAEHAYHRAESNPIAKPAPPEDTGKVRVETPLNWPAFRGADASGVADGQQPPLTWNVAKGTNVVWKTPIPGLGHSCPIVWGNRVFVTTAVSGDPDPKVRIGNYGDVESVNDVTKHTWQVFCLDRDTGKVLWQKTACEGVPKNKRHLKGSQANCTPVTDGKRVVACFGPEGMYCWDFEGKLLWKRDLGTLDSSFVLLREHEWGYGSSPVLYEDSVILQCDLSKESFVAAYSLEDGRRLWSTPRDEIPSWSSPIIWRNSKRAELVTNAAQYARGYDPSTGKELWCLAKKSEVTVPAPVARGDLLVITSGNRPIQPIFAIRPGAEGDISLKEGQSKNAHIIWSTMRGGPYMPSPILYGKYLYTCANAGMLTCYEAETGKQVYKERLGGVSYTASPVAADGRLYFTAEQGDVRVVRAGPEFKLLAVNDMADVCMATPAISNGLLFVRTQHHLVALGRTDRSE